MITRYNLGILSEYAAVLFLKLKAYRILERRYRSHLGEIDIIATKGNLIVFLEVKTIREGNDAFPVVSNKQLDRIRRSATIYLNRGYNNYDVRFDLITVSNLILVRHYKGVF